MLANFVSHTSRVILTTIGHCLQVSINTGLGMSKIKKNFKNILKSFLNIKIVSIDYLM
jgi:hypothetical protein